MSVKIMAQVWTIPITPTQKLVLLALADNCNDRGECYPSITNICEKSGLSDRGVQKAILELENMGFLMRSMRHGRSTLYTLTTERGSPRTINEPSIEPSPKRQNSETQKPRSRKFDFRAALLSVGVENKNANAWLEVRKAKRQANTEPAFDLLVSQAKQAGVSVNEAVNFSAGMSWAGFKAEWYVNHKPKPKPESRHTGFNERD